VTRLNPHISPERSFVVEASGLDGQYEYEADDAEDAIEQHREWLRDAYREADLTAHKGEL